MRACIISLAIFCTAILIGCGSITPPIEKPIIEDHSHDRRITTFATIPSRRMIIMYQKKEGGPVFTCSEPPADVSDNIASALSIAASAKGKLFGSESDGNANANLAKTLVTNAQFLTKRTQGLQLYRDGMYHLCQARMNEVISSDNEYMKSAKYLFDESIKLIKKELDNLQHTQPLNVTVDSDETLKKLIQRLEALNKASSTAETN